MKNLPNQITISRIFLIFMFVVLANFDTGSGENFHLTVSAHTARICHLAAYLIAVFAGLTDLVDGYLARKFHLESDFGRLIDPLADKIFIVATFSMMVDYQYMPSWLLIVILAREFLVTGLRTLASAKGIVIAADRWGKLKTASQMAALLICGASWTGLFQLPDLRTPGIFHDAWMVLLYIVALMTVASGLWYFIKHKKLYLGSMF